MADLDDAELVAELENYGETVPLPIKPKQRPILVKKLNHLRVRNRKLTEAVKSSQQPKPSGKRLTSPASNNIPTGSAANRFFTVCRYKPRTATRNESPSNSNLDALSSDDSDIEPVPDVRQSEADSSSPASRRSSGRIRNNPLSDSVLRTLRRRTADHRVDDSPENNSATRRQGNKVTNNGESRTSSGRSSLYPDLSSFTSSFTPNRSEDNFESSDSDGDLGTSYYVENKSINTSFASFKGDQDPVGIHHRSFNPSPSSSAPSLNSSMSHNKYSGRYSTNRVQPFKSRFSDFLPKLLIGVVVVFFSILSVTYIILHKDFFFAWFSNSGNLGSNDNLLLCKGEIHPGCYGMPEIQRSLSRIQNLYTELSAKKGKVLCEEEAAGTEFMNTNILRMKIESITLADTQSSRMYDCCIRHILANPHWNIKALREDGSEAKTVGEVAKLESAVASMSFWCRLERSFMSVVYGLGLLIFVVGVSGLVWYYVRQHLKAKQQEHAEVFVMVEKIIELLQEHHDQAKGEDSYLAVQHVRDQLLSPSKRHQLQRIWDKAVAFIAANESRIRLETKIIRGEEFEVWHWLQPSQSNGKIWQGLAFGVNNASNEVIYSPSPCLKIRNMFDSAIESEDDWENGVVDAILEKCSTIPSIVHVYVDTNSLEGCVYLKCSSLEAAGKVRKSLNSWWFDGRLVTVKHLKADYYHRRWPESRNAVRPLKPSTDLMKSISQHMYPSSLELT